MSGFPQRANSQPDVWTDKLACSRVQTTVLLQDALFPGLVSPDRWALTSIKNTVLGFNGFSQNRFLSERIDQFKYLLFISCRWAVFVSLSSDSFICLCSLSPECSWWDIFSFSGDWFSCVSFWNYWIQSPNRMTQFLGKKCLISEWGGHRIKMTAGRLVAKQGRSFPGGTASFLQPSFAGTQGPLLSTPEVPCPCSFLL